jgi:hypothetical protein
MVKTSPVRDGRPARPQRIYIIGGGGSGKTTLGRQLARALGLELTELDGSSGAGERACGSRWVIEGIFVWGTAVWLERAELVVWLAPILIAGGGCCGSSCVPSAATTPHRLGSPPGQPTGTRSPAPPLPAWCGGMRPSSSCCAAPARYGGGAGPSPGAGLSEPAMSPHHRNHRADTDPSATGDQALRAEPEVAGSLVGRPKSGSELEQGHCWPAGVVRAMA